MAFVIIHAYAHCLNDTLKNCIPWIYKTLFSMYVNMCFVFFKLDFEVTHWWKRSLEQFKQCFQALHAITITNCIFCTIYFVTCRSYISLHADIIFHYMQTLFFTLYFITCKRYISLHADVIFHIIFYCTQALIEQTDFLVVGVIGLQGCGKSTILSLLAGNTEADSYRSV